MSTFEVLPVFDPFTEAYQHDPHALHRAVFAAGPVARHPFGLAVLGYEQVQAVLRDHRFVMPPALMLTMYGITGGPVYDRVASNLLVMNGAEHTRLRRLVAQSFRPVMADALRSQMSEAMADLLDGCGRHVELVELVRMYPIAVICSLLGIDRDDWELISTTTDDLFRTFSPTVVDELDIIDAAGVQQDAFLDRLIEQRCDDGLDGDDLVTQLLLAEHEGDRLSRAELKMLVATVLGAGTDTTRNQLAAAMYTFAEHPHQWSALRAEPSLVASAVNEVLRFCPITLAVPRVARVDATIGDVTVPAGTVVMVVTGAANRDPGVFVDPDRFDIARVDAEPMLTLGGGIHHCLGVHLAKAELAEALTQMARRWERVTLNGPVTWKPRTSVGGPVALPLKVS